MQAFKPKNTRFCTLLIAVFISAFALQTAALAKQKRSKTAVKQFKMANPCPAHQDQYQKKHLICPGYIVDHVISLYCGGDDAPHNMQWQTIADAKAKDRWENKSCKTN